MVPPEPAFATTEENAYTFERVVISSLPFNFPYLIEMHAVLQARVQGWQAQSALPLNHVGTPYEMPV
jgi:hypothetical protein